MPENLGPLGKPWIRKTIDTLQRETHSCIEVAGRMGQLRLQRSTLPVTWRQVEKIL